MTTTRTLTTDLAPFSNAYLMLSKAATIRWLLVILPSLMGTLKSTLEGLREICVGKSIIKTKKIVENSSKIRKFPGRSNSYRIKTRFPDKSNFSMLNLFKAMVNCGMAADNRLISNEELNILLDVLIGKNFFVFFARSILHYLWEV